NTSSTQWEVSRIPTVLSWSGSISFDNFLPFVLLWLVIIVAVVGVGVTSSVQLLLENTDSVRSNQQMRPTAPSVPLKLKAFAIVATYASRAAGTLSATSF
ncbi:hypothetical protein Tco_1323745, partial [Tanacetum coccineum]